MMRLHGYINDILIDVFIDCGSGNEFSKPRHHSQAWDTHLCTFPTEVHYCLRQSGHTLSLVGIVDNITMQIQDYTFTDSFLLLPVAGCDLVLSAQWLDSLGFIG